MDSSWVLQVKFISIFICEWFSLKSSKNSELYLEALKMFSMKFDPIFRNFFGNEVFFSWKMKNDFHANQSKLQLNNSSPYLSSYVCLPHQRVAFWWCAIQKVHQRNEKYFHVKPDRDELCMELFYLTFHHPSQWKIEWK